MNKHNISFFGQKVGMLLSSSAWDKDFIFIKMLKKKESGEWEKPSQGEGKSVKFSLGEMIQILKVLEKNESEFNTFHTFKKKGGDEERTPISFKWEDFKVLWINIASYKKALQTPQIEIFQLLLKHLIKEKIELATFTGKTTAEEDTEESSEVVKGESPFFNEEISETKKEVDLNFFIGKGEKASSLEGTIKQETDKAICITFGNEDYWIPKSRIQSNYVSDNTKSEQIFLIENWILQKKKLI